MSLVLNFLDTTSYFKIYMNISMKSTAVEKYESEKNCEEVIY